MMNKLRIVLLLSLGCFAAAYAQWQPLPPEDISLTGLSPAVRADTSIKVDGKIVDQDTLAGHVTILFEGYYRFIPHIWIDSGNEQRNESFYLELRQGADVSLPLDPNAGPYKIVADDTVLYAQKNLFVDRDAGLFYLKPGVHEIWMLHYVRVADQYPQFINHYPDGSGISGAESLYIWDLLAIYPEPRVDAALAMQNLLPDYCFADPGQNVLVPGDTTTVRLTMSNLTTDGYRNAFPSGELKLALPPNFTPFDFSLAPQPDYVNRTDSLVWTIDQFSDSTVQEFTVSFKARLSPYAAVATDFEFSSQFFVANDLDSSNNVASDVLHSVNASPCSTDCFIQLYSDDADRVVNAEDSVRYVLIYGNSGPYSAANPFVNVTFPDYIEILNYDPGFQRNGNVFSRSFTEFQPGFTDTVFFNGVVTHPVPETVNALVAIGGINFNLDNDPSNNQSIDELQVGIGQYADVSISQAIVTDSTGINNGVVEHWAAFDSSVQYTLTVKNESPYPALNLTVQDSLPAGVVTNDAVQWTIPRLEAGESRQFVVVCRVTDSLSAEGAPFVNMASVVSENERNDDQANNVSRQVFYLYKVAPPPLTDIVLSYVAVTDSMVVYNGRQLPAAVQGEPFLFRLTVVNNGPDDADNVIVRKVLPPGLQNIQFDDNTFTPGDTLTWIIGRLPAGGTWTVNMTAAYNAVQDDPVLLTATADAVAQNDPDDSNNHAFCQVVIVKAPQCDVTATQYILTDSVSVINDAEISYVALDEEFTIQLWVHNRGTASALQTVAVDSLPAGIRVINFSPAANVVDRVATWNKGTIAPGDSVLFNLTCIVEDKTLPSGHIFTNTLRADAANEPVENRYNNASSKQFYLFKKNAQPSYDIALSYTVAADSAAQYAGEQLPAALEGDTLSYTMTAHNAGPDDALNVVIQNVLPAGLSRIHFDNDNYAHGDTLIWIVDSIPAGESWSTNMTAVYNGVEGKSVLLTAVATVFAEWDSDSTNNQASNRVVILKRKKFDLIVSQDIVTDSVLVSNNETLNYVAFNEEFKIKLNVLNWGDAAARRVVVKNTLPPGIKVLRAMPAAQVAGDTLSWSFDAIAQGNSAFIELTCMVKNQGLPAGTVFVNSVNARADNEPPENMQNNSSQKKFYLYIGTAEPDVRFDLALSHFAQTDSLIDFNGTYINAVVVDDPITYHITLRNKGPVAARDIRVSTTEPEYFHFAQFSKTAQQNENEFFWLIDSLAGGEEWRVNYQARYDPLPQLTFFVETIALVTAALDSTPANNVASTVVAILDSTPVFSDTWVDLSARDNAGETVDQLNPNQDFDFVIDYGNKTNPAENVLIWFVLPPGFLYTGAGPEPDYTNGDTLFWRIDLLDGDGQIVVNMRSPDLEPGSYSFSGSAFIRAENDDPGSLQDNATSHVVAMTIEELPELVIDIRTSPSQMDVSDSAFVSVTFSQPILEWDLSVALPDGQVLTDFGDDYISRTKIAPQTWYKCDQPFRHPKLLNSEEQDEILFTVTATSIHGVNGQATATLVVVSSNEMRLDRNVFRSGQESFIEIHFKNAGGSECTLSLYDLAGHLITKIGQGYYQGGWNMVAWDGRRQGDGSFVGSGAYVVTLETKYERYYKKLIIVR